MSRIGPQKPSTLVPNPRLPHNRRTCPQHQTRRGRPEPTGSGSAKSLPVPRPDGAHSPSQPSPSGYIKRVFFVSRTNTRLAHASDGFVVPCGLGRVPPWDCSQTYLLHRSPIRVFGARTHVGECSVSPRRQNGRSTRRGTSGKWSSPFPPS